jgi:hypothetical protein
MRCPAIYNITGDGFSVTLGINNGIPLQGGSYRLLICGTTSIVDSLGMELLMAPPGHIMDGQPHQALLVKIKDTRYTQCIEGNRCMN